MHYVDKPSRCRTGVEIGREKGVAFGRDLTPTNLSDRQRAALESLPTRHLKTGRAYQIRLALQELYDQSSAEAGASTSRHGTSGQLTAGWPR